MNNQLKKVVKILIIAIFAVALYFSGQVVGVEHKRVDGAIENLKNSRSFEFEGDFVLDGSRDGFYDISFFGYYQDRKISGEFILETRINDQNEEIEGSFLYDFSNLYISLKEDALRVSFEEIFKSEEELKSEKDWLKKEIPFDIFYQIKEVLVHQDNEGEDYYHYGVILSDFWAFKDLETELFLKKEDLSFNKILIDQTSDLVRDIYFTDSLPTFSEGNSISLNLKLNFDNFNKQFDEIILPEL